jgi:CelD/BcsL family acetyltransferase involved in cellulose biosynthesis
MTMLLRDSGLGTRDSNLDRIPDPESRIPGPLTVDLVTDYDDFVALEAEWNDTVDRAGVTDPFLRHEWFRTWWDCFGADRALHIIIVRTGGRIAAIAPLLRENVKLYGLPVRRIDLLHNDHTPRADFIVAGTPAAAYEAIWNALRDTCGTWDLVQLSRVPRESPTLAAIQRCAGDERMSTGTWQGDVSPYLTLAGTWEDYCAALGAKFRSNLRNRLSRLLKVGEPVLEVLQDGEAIAGSRDEALRLEDSGWKRDAGTAICSDPAIQRFYTLLAERASARGWLRLMFLCAGGRRIATSYGARYGNRLFLFKTGYDPEFATCAPFKLLTYFAIQAAYREGLSEVDFLGDVEPWKLEWTETSRPHDWLFVFSHGVRARLLHSIKFQMVPELKKWRA